MTPLTKTYVFPSQVSDMDFSCFGQSVSSGKTLGFQFPTGEKRFPLKKKRATSERTRATVQLAIMSEVRVELTHLYFQWSYHIFIISIDIFFHTNSKQDPMVHHMARFFFKAIHEVLLRKTFF